MFHIWLTLPNFTHWFEFYFSFHFNNIGNNVADKNQKRAQYSWNGLEGRRMTSHWVEVATVTPTMAKWTHSVAAVRMTVCKTLEKPLKCYRAVLRLTVKTNPSKNLSYPKNDRKLKNRELNVSKYGHVADASTSIWTQAVNNMKRGAQSQ